MASPSLSYDPSQVVVTFAGASLHGFAEDFIEAERHEDAFMLQVGADGEPARSRNRNRSGTVKLKLQQASVSNDALSGLAALDEAGGAGTGPLLIKDLNGSTLLNAPVAWIKKIAPVTYGKEHGSREWAFETGEFIMFVGSNT